MAKVFVISEKPLDTQDIQIIRQSSHWMQEYGEFIELSQFNTLIGRAGKKDTVVLIDNSKNTAFLKLAFNVKMICAGEMLVKNGVRVYLLNKTEIEQENESVLGIFRAFSEYSTVFAVWEMRDGQLCSKGTVCALFADPKTNTLSKQRQNDESIPDFIDWTNFSLDFLGRS